MTDSYIRRIADALYALRDDIDRGGEYPDAEWRAASRFGVKSKDLREAYDEFTSATHDPVEYL